MIERSGGNVGAKEARFLVVLEGMSSLGMGWLVD